jgi:hypothetical protein
LYYSTGWLKTYISDSGPAVSDFTFSLKKKAFAQGQTGNMQESRQMETNAT